MPATPPPTTIFPTEERFVNVVREAVNGTIPAAPYGTTIPEVGLEPEDKPIWLLDDSLRGSMGDIYDMLQGPIYADVTLPASPVYVDMIGHAIYNAMGDYSQSCSGTPVATTTLNGAVAIGATSVVVTSATSFATGQWIQIYATGSTGPAEIVQVGTYTSGTTIPLAAATPIRFPHVTGAAVNITAVTNGTYQHAFALLNSGYLGATNYQNFGQPPTHTWTDRTQVPTFGGSPGYSRQYAYSCFQNLTFTGNAEKLLEWNGSFASYPGQIASSLATASVSSVRAFPDFNCTFQLATTSALAPVYDIVEWQVVLTRQLKVQFTNDGMQNPYVIGRGKLGVSGKLTFGPATDETALLYMLNNTQPQLELLVTNNLATTNPLYQALQIDMLYCDFDTSKINSSGVLFGYDVGFKSHHTAQTRNSIACNGWSGGNSACKITVSNAVPIF